MTELCKIMKECGSDKGGGYHNYTFLYTDLFKDLRDKNLNIFELGIGSNNIDIPSNMGISGKPGASLRGWREYFKFSNIYAADIDSRILFHEDRIKTFYCDQTSKESIQELWNQEELKDLLFDIIIDDGLHEYEANLSFFENSIHKLKPGGFYICEDLLPETVESFKNIIPALKVKYQDKKFQITKLTNPQNDIDNVLLIVS